MKLTLQEAARRAGLTPIQTKTIPTYRGHQDRVEYIWRCLGCGWSGTVDEMLRADQDKRHCPTCMEHTKWEYAR